MNHALKTERINVEIGVADGIQECIHEFLTELGYSNDRISELECRSRDGFIPHSHNLGGLEAIAFTDQFMASIEGTGFDKADETLERYRKMDVEYFLADRPTYPKDESKWTDDQREKFDEYRQNDSEATVLFSVDCMLTGLERGVFTLNIRMCVCVKDAPYHRQFDDKLEFDITFKHCKSLGEKLKKLLRNKDVKTFAGNLREAY